MFSAFTRLTCYATSARVPASIDSDIGLDVESMHAYGSLSFANIIWPK
jgi:hypothetical protein